MPGFIDTTTGLCFGEGLQFQAKIGGSGLIIQSDEIVAPGPMVSELGDSLITESGDALVTETA